MSRFRAPASRRLPSSSSSHVIAALLLAALTVLMTWPLAPRMSDHVHDAGDPLLNGWILAWDVEQLATGNVRHFFDANIFYPHRRTLAYSEHLLPQSLLAAAPLLLAGNPILAYNAVFLFAFFSSALGMYVLAYRLTGSAPASVAAGVIYGFSPFMFDHLSHLQVLSAGGIPLTYFFLVRFFADEKWRDLLGIATCFVIQVLANGYYALYLSLFLLLTLLYHIAASGKSLSRLFFLKLAVMAAIAVALTGPFFYQYFLFRGEMAFTREVDTAARLASYVATPETNFLYGRWLARNELHEALLFPGLVPACLAVVALAALAARRRSDLGAGRDKVFGPRVSAVRHFPRVLLQPLRDESAWLQLFGMTMLFAVALSFGSKGPFRLLHAYVPGFDAIRAVARVHVLTMLALAAAAAFGARRVFERQGRWKRTLAVIAILALVTVEYLSIPMPLEKIPVGDEIPPVYQWLALQDGPTPVLELPLRPGYRLGCERVYYSIYHRKAIVNGFSGFIPPLYGELERRWNTEPPERTVEAAVTLGVRYLVVHGEQMSAAESQGLRQSLAGRARLVAGFSADEVWELSPAPAAGAVRASAARRTLPRDRWRPASSEPQPAALALDGDLATRWHSNGPQRPGVWFEVDLGEAQSVSGISLALAASPRDYPRGYEVRLSADGRHWTPVRRGVMESLPILAFLQPRRLAVEIRFPPSAARFVRVACTRGDPVYYWSIYELEIYG